MCQSKAEGGARCFTHAMDDDAEALKKRRDTTKKRNKKGDAAEAKRLHIEYLTTEEGIEELEEAGRLDLAAKFARRRNQKIDAYNREFGKSKPPFLPYEQRDQRPVTKGTRKPPVWGHDGFNMRERQKAVHRDTGTLWNPEGFNKFGVHKENGERFHPATELDKDGYDRSGYHRATGLNRAGYDCDGYNEHGWDRNGFSRPDARGRCFNFRGEPKGEYPDAWGWNWSNEAWDWKNEETGSNHDPQGQDFWTHQETKNPKWWL